MFRQLLFILTFGLTTAVEWQQINFIGSVIFRSLRVLIEKPTIV